VFSVHVPRTSLEKTDERTNLNLIRTCQCRGLSDHPHILLLTVTDNSLLDSAKNVARVWCHFHLSAMSLAASDFVIESQK